MVGRVSAERKAATAAAEVLEVGILAAVIASPPCLPHREIEERGMSIEKGEAVAEVAEEEEEEEEAVVALLVAYALSKARASSSEFWSVGVRESPQGRAPPTPPSPPPTRPLTEVEKFKGGKGSCGADTS